MSEFWRQQPAPLRDRYRQAPTLDFARVAELVAEVGYGFEPLPESAERATSDVGFVRADAVAEELQTAAAGVKAAAGIADKSMVEHARALVFLRGHGLLDDYLSTLEALRIRSSMSAARHWYYARLVMKLARDNLRRPWDVLEIGGGGGNLASLILSSGCARSYTIDRIRLWEEEAFQMAVRSAFNAVPSLAVLRAGLVGTTDA